MKKITSSLIALSLLSANIAAFEWGGKIDNTTKFDDDVNKDFDLNQKDSLSLWVTSPLNKNNTASFSAEGLYSFEYDQKDDDVTNIADINLFKFSVYKKVGSEGTLLFNIGRFGISDSSNIVFNQKCDGLLFGYSVTKLSVLAYGGYTGLLNSLTTSIITPEDSEFESDDNDFYSLAAKYIPYGIMFKFPSLFANQNANVQSWGFSDLNGDSFNRYYASVDLNGYLGKLVSYKIGTTFGTEDFDGMTNLSFANLSFYPCDFAEISVGGTYASGDNGSLKPFVGFSSMTSCLAASEPEYSDIVKFELNSIFTINTYGTVAAGGAAVFDSTVDYKGFQWQFDTNWNILSDIQLGFSAYQFFGDNSDENKTSFSLKASINF